MVECLPRIQEALGLTPALPKKPPKTKKTQTQTKQKTDVKIQDQGFSVSLDYHVLVEMLIPPPLIRLRPE